MAPEIHWLKIAACAFAFFSACSKVELDTSAINALIAPKHAYKLQFETREVTTGFKHRARYTVAVPRGWKYDYGTFIPTNEKLFGRSWITLRTSCEECRTGIERDLSCSAENCTPLNWIDVLESRFPTQGSDHILDETSDGRRVMIVRSQNVGVVRVYWWTDGAPFYHACIAWLDEHLVDSAPAFAKACELAIAH